MKHSFEGTIVAWMLCKCGVVCQRNAARFWSRLLSFWLLRREKRYVWFRRALKELDVRYDGVFPKQWRMSQRFCEQFCNVTRSAIEDSLCT
jgi:hypothetical protein